MPGLLGPCVSLRPVPLLAHQPAEPGFVDRQPLFGGHLKGEVDREPEGIVQGEGLVGRKAHSPNAFGIAHGKVQDRRPRGEGAPEGLFFGVGDLADPREVLVDLGVGRHHLVSAQRQQLGQRGGVDAEQPHRPHRTADQPAQHVTTRLVARGDAIGDQHHRAAHVVGDHPHPHVVGLVGAVPLAAQLGGARDDGVDLVDLVDVVDALQQERHPF